ncbi:hypothetical protein GCM10023196_065740 [Actinoallomurus vinaceus]|uniref:Peptidase C39-like domain-containing protein n=1 Tax=Actinoallomurus vinaceus TaxID=1080074 RepID=A0ABP8UJ55_9ACTN
MAKARLLASALVLTPPLLLALPAGAQAATAPSSASAPAAAAVQIPQSGSPVEIATLKKLKLTGQKQSTNYYCAPASVRAVISTWGRHLPSQKTLAGYMKTTKKNGTASDRVPDGLNRALSPRLDERYMNFHPNNAGFVWNVVVDNVGKRHHAVIARVLFGYKPWGRHTGDKTGHVMVIYGYNTAGKKLYWYDPWDNTRHTASLTASWNAINKGNRYITAQPHT